MRITELGVAFSALGQVCILFSVLEKRGLRCEIYLYIKFRSLLWKTIICSVRSRSRPVFSAVTKAWLEYINIILSFSQTLYKFQLQQKCAWLGTEDCNAAMDPLFSLTTLLLEVNLMCWRMQLVFVCSS